MQPGAPFVVDGVASMGSMVLASTDGNRSVLSIPPFAIELPYPVTAFHEVAKVRAGEAAVLFSTATETLLVTARHAIGAAGGPIEIASALPVARGMKRVVVTDALTLIGGDTALIALDASRTVVTEDPVDVAATGSRLAVIDARGVRFFDARAVPEAARDLAEATAIAWDPWGARWLVAAGGDLVAIRGPADPIEVLARDVGDVIRVRSERGDVFSLVTASGRFFEIVRGAQRTISNRPPGWVDFIAGDKLFADEGEGIRAVYADTRCGCRTRTVASEWEDHKRPAGDGSYWYSERFTCPVCGASWTEEVYGA